MRLTMPTAFAGIFALMACGPYSTFVPYDPMPSKVAGPPKVRAGIAISAVEVFAGDVPYLGKAQGQVIGQVTGHTGENGLCQAARNGGTHVVRRSTFTKAWATNSVTAPGTNFLGAPNGTLQTSARTVESVEETQHFVVIRVEREKWAQLPAVIRPVDVTTESSDNGPYYIFR